MLVYCDSAVLIYHLDGNDPFRSRAQSRLTKLFAAQDRVATSHLVRLECRVHPIRRNDLRSLQQIDQFFAHPDLVLLPLDQSTFDRATDIGARWNFRATDAIHLAAAIEGGCGAFLTNDRRLTRFQGIPIELLP